jgi:hypothetical protein
MLMSPIMMVPSALPLPRIQEMYYNLVGDLKVRSGPLKAQDPHIRLSKNDYAPRSALIAAPIVFQTRLYPSADCPHSYSREWLQAQHQQVASSTCGSPFSCSADVLSRPEFTMSCKGGFVEGRTQFGLESIEFQGSVGFADLLFSITDNDFIFRDGGMMATSNFFDSLTQTVSLILVFYSPQYGVTSVLTVDADLSGPTPAVVAVSLKHYEILEGVELTTFVAVECVLLVTVLSMAYDIARELRRMWIQYRRGESITDEVGAVWQLSPPTRAGLIGKLAADVVTVVLVIVSGALRTSLKINSARETQRIVGGLTSIPWDSSDLPMSKKKR